MESLRRALQSHQSDPSRRVIVPEGCRYSRSCELYRLRESKRSVTMRQAHVGGDKVFGDYAGDTAPVIVDRLTGEVCQAQIFVAVIGASSSS